MEIQERVRPLVEPMAQLSPVVQGMGTIVELGQQVIENMPAIETIERIQANAEIGMLSDAEIRASGFSAQELAAIGPPPAVIDAAAVIRQFDTAIGATLPDQVTLRGFQSSWPAIDAFNHQLAVLEGQGVSYSQIIDNLRQSDFLQRNNDLLVSPAVQIYETCCGLPEEIANCAGILDTFTPIESIIANINGIHLFNRLSPVLEAALSTHPNELFWRAYQRKCLRALMSAKWCPSLLFDLPEQEMIPLNKILAKEMPPEKRVESIDRFVYRRFGRDYIAGILEDWAKLPIPSCVSRLMCEAVRAYRRKEYGLVIHSLPVQWEGIVK